MGLALSKSLTQRLLRFCAGSTAGLALLVFLVLNFRFFLGGAGRVLSENGGTGEKGKAECGGCDGLHLTCLLK